MRIEITEKKEEYPKRVIRFKQQRGRINTTAKIVITNGREMYQSVDSERIGLGEGEGNGDGDTKRPGAGEGDGVGIGGGVGVGVGEGEFSLRRIWKTGTILSAITTR